MDQTRELALGTLPADVEVGFTRKPHGRVVLDDNVQPFGPSAPLGRLDIGNLRVDPNLDRASSDTDLRAKEAVLGLFDRGLPVSKIQRAFSVGAFGLEKNRRFVPTRWSITAVDDTIGKDLRESVKTHPLINEIRVYEAIGYDDRFLVVMLPRSWRYELIEAWYPNTLWNPIGRDIVLFGDHGDLFPTPLVFIALGDGPLLQDAFSTGGAKGALVRIACKYLTLYGNHR